MTPTLDPLNLTPASVASGPQPNAGGGLLDGQRSFGEVLSKAGGPAGRKTAEDEAWDAARDFVAMAFVQPVLKQLRETNHAAAPFAPGKGEQQFRALMDAEIARKVVRASDWPLVDRLAQRLLEHKDAASPREGSVTR